MKSSNEFLKTTGHRPRLMEFSIVLLVISFLISVGFNFYDLTVEQTPKTVLAFQAGSFHRMVQNIHAIGAGNANAEVDIGGVVFYLNENGWPANTSASMSPSVKNQTELECYQLWDGIFDEDTSQDNYNQIADFRASLNKNVICQYSIVLKQEDSYFFDYDIRNGAVVIHRN